MDLAAVCESLQYLGSERVMRISMSSNFAV